MVVKTKPVSLIKFNLNSLFCIFHSSATASASASECIWKKQANKLREGFSLHHFLSNEDSIRDAKEKILRASIYV